MKKGLSIILLLLLLAAIFHISVATHYCDGKEVATVVSFSGKLASCCKECLEIGLPLPGTNITKHCCNDILIICGIDNNYELSYSFVPKSCQFTFQVLALQIGLSVNFSKDLIPLNKNVSSPGALLSGDVDISNICVFRI